MARRRRRAAPRRAPRAPGGGGRPSAPPRRAGRGAARASAAQVKLDLGFAKCGGGWTRWPVGSRAFAPSSSSSCVTNSQRTGFAEFATMKRLSETICSTFAAIARVLNSTSAVPRGRPPSSGGSRSTTQRTMSPNCWNASHSNEHIQQRRSGRTRPAASASRAPAHLEPPHRAHKAPSAAAYNPHAAPNALSNGSGTHSRPKNISDARPRPYSMWQRARPRASRRSRGRSARRRARCGRARASSNCRRPCRRRRRRTRRSAAPRTRPCGSRGRRCPPC